MRPLSPAPEIDEILVSVITLGELTLGVRLALDAATRARRLATLSYVESTFEPLPIDAEVARVWATVVASLQAIGRGAPVNDSWIAAVALARGLAVVTQDDDYDAMPGLRVIRV